MTKDELTQGNIDDVTLVSKHENKAMGFMAYKVSEQELIDARNAVIKRMFELREPKQGLMTKDELNEYDEDDIAHPREGERIFLTDDYIDMLEEGLTDLFGHDRTYATPVCKAIRDLRDAAMAVCDSCQDQFSDDYSIRHFTVDEDKVNELRQLLPKEPQ